MQKKLSQDAIVHRHLLRYGKITSIEAVDRYRIQRLAAIIPKLIKRGVPILKRTEFNPKDRTVHWRVYEIKTVKMP